VRVGWAKAPFAPCPPLLFRMRDWMVGTPPDAFASGDFAHPTRPGHLAPLAGRGRIASSDAIRVRGTLRESECVESPPHPKPSLRSGFDLSPQAGRGKEAAST
jgi:hypothetical protein